VIRTRLLRHQPGCVTSESSLCIAARVQILNGQLQTRALAALCSILLYQGTFVCSVIRQQRHISGTKVALTHVELNALLVSSTQNPGQCRRWNCRHTQHVRPLLLTHLFPACLPGLLLLLLLLLCVVCCSGEAQNEEEQPQQEPAEETVADNGADRSLAQRSTARHSTQHANISSAQRALRHSSA
jgi:hypothetical protein